MVIDLVLAVLSCGAQVVLYSAVYHGGLHPRLLQPLLQAIRSHTDATAPLCLPVDEALHVDEALDVEALNGEALDVNVEALTGEALDVDECATALVCERSVGRV